MNLLRTDGTAAVLMSGCLLISLAGCEQAPTTVKETAPPIVHVSRPIVRDVTDYEVFTARTVAVQSVDVTPRITGYLTKILFKDGDIVKKDDVLFEVDDRTYKAQLDQAKAALELSKASLVKNQAQYDIGLNVQKQNPGAISQQELTQRLGARDESQASVDKSKADIELAQLYYDWCKVQAPIGGRIGQHQVDIGNLVTAQVTTLATIVSVKPMWAYFNVDQNTAERYQALIAGGKLTSPRDRQIPVQMAIGSNAEYAFDGAIDFINNQLDPSTGSIQVRASFPNEDSQLVAGLFTRIRAPSSPPHKALLVVDSAIGTNQGQRFVLVVNDQQEVEYRIVDVGQMHSGLREVKQYRTVTEPGPDGKTISKQVEVLKPTDRVLVAGLLRVRPGVKVDPQEVDMLTLLRNPQSSSAGEPKSTAKPDPPSK